MTPKITPPPGRRAEVCAKKTPNGRKTAPKGIKGRWGISSGPGWMFPMVNATLKGPGSIALIRGEEREETPYEQEKEKKKTLTVRGESAQ
jgi:hypothetical protein